MLNVDEIVGFVGRGDGEGGGKGLTSLGTNALNQKAEGNTRLLFGVVRTTEGFRVTVSLTLDGVVVDTKYGADQLKHHALAVLESLVAQYVIDCYDHPEQFFDAVQVR